MKGGLQYNLDPPSLLKSLLCRSSASFWGNPYIHPQIPKPLNAKRENAPRALSRRSPLHGPQQPRSPKPSLAREGGGEGVRTRGSGFRV